MRKLFFFLCVSQILWVTACVSPKQSTEIQPPNTLSDYLEKRTSLLQKDSVLYFDYGEVLSPKEQRLNQQLVKLQQSMIADYKANHFFPPARNFYNSKAHIEQTSLFKILKKMPKGGILHLHSGAMGDARWMAQKAIEIPEMHVFWNATNEKYTKGQLHAYTEGKAPKGFRPAKDLAKINLNFQQELIDLLTFDEAMDSDSVDIWGEFEYVFQRIGGFLTYEKVAADYLIHGAEILIEDNIQHAEFRTFFTNRFYDLEGNKNTEAEYIELLEKVERAAREMDPDFTFILLQQSLRFFSKATIWEAMQAAHDYRTKYPRWIRGFDLVAEEDAGYPTLFHIDEYLRLDSLNKATGVELPLYLHNGESNWMSTDNLYDAVLLGSKRIGHGFNLFRFPTLMEMVKERDICIEVSPLSNQILGYVRDLRNHPASTYLRRGVNCVISSDDPLIFDYHGLSYDFWSVCLAWELDLAALKKLSRNGITYSALTDAEKAKALQVWEKRWGEFVDVALIMLEN
ncbi:MAG: hypothetical protein AAGJ18_22530, partial [Bacteroidota bacterium]